MAPMQVAKELCHGNFQVFSGFQHLTDRPKMHSVVLAQCISVYN